MFSYHPVKREPSKVPLLSLMKTNSIEWPNQATSVTQERSGELLFWTGSFEDIKIARKLACSNQGLRPWLGLNRLVACIAISETGKISRLAKDWQSAIVTREAFEQSCIVHEDPNERMDTFHPKNTDAFSLT